MDFIVDLIMEIVIEVFAEVYVELSCALMPNRALSKKAHRTLTFIFTLIGCIFFILLLVGVIILVGSNGTSTLGWSFVIASAIYILITVILKIRYNGKK